MSFKLNDEVIIIGGGMRQHYSKAIVEKVYKNGNVIVDGMQYRQEGHRAGKYEYHQARIVSYTPEKWEELTAPLRLKRKQSNLAELAMRLTDEQELDKLIADLIEKENKE